MVFGYSFSPGLIPFLITPLLTLIYSLAFYVAGNKVGVGQEKDNSAKNSRIFSLQSFLISLLE